MGQQEREISEEQREKKGAVKIGSENLAVFTVDLIMI